MVKALRAGDEDAFVALVERLHGTLLRLALVFVPNRAVAEEVVQETWLRVLQGIGRFEERSSLKTWISRILVNTAKTRARREGRSVPFSALGEADDGTGEPFPDEDRFLPADDPNYPGHWTSIPKSWDDVPERRLLSGETRARIEAALEGLPARQREVLTLRDIEGWHAEEVCNFLELSESNQRVLLHRARARVRRALEQYFEEE